MSKIRINEGGRQKLSPEQIRRLIALSTNGEIGVTALAARFSLSTSTVSRILKESKSSGEAA